MRGRKKGAYGMRPCVNTNFMTTHILFYEDVRILNATRTNDEESSADIFLTEIIEEFPFF